MKAHFLTKLILFVVVVAALWLLASAAEYVTKVPKEFWMETVCISHIALNITEDILHDKESH